LSISFRINHVVLPHCVGPLTIGLHVVNGCLDVDGNMTMSVTVTVSTITVQYAMYNCYLYSFSVVVKNQPTLLTYLLDVLGPGNGVNAFPLTLTPDVA